MEHSFVASCFYLYCHRKLRVIYLLLLLSLLLLFLGGVVVLVLPYVSDCSGGVGVNPREVAGEVSDVVVGWVEADGASDVLR